MKVTFIEHSGFTVELDHHVLLFDYYQGDIPSFSKDKELLVFASHSHPDHFTTKIFQLKKEYPKVTYILSDDIRTKEDAVWMKAYETKTVKDVEIETLKSNDQGVAFVVSVEGKVIYHAGDLNWWHWNGEPEEDNQYYKDTFLTEMKRIEGRTFDVAFVPLDPRQEDKYCLGMNYFLTHTKAKAVFPMHAFGRYAIAKHYLGCSDGREWKDKVYSISGPGQEFILDFC